MRAEKRGKEAGDLYERRLEIGLVEAGLSVVEGEFEGNAPEVASYQSDRFVDLLNHQRVRISMKYHM